LSLISQTKNKNKNKVKNKNKTKNKAKTETKSKNKMEQDNPNSPLEPNFTAIAIAITLQAQVLQPFLSTMPTTITAIPPSIPPKYHTKYYPPTALRFKISTIWILAPRKDKHTVDKLANSPFIQCGAYQISKPTFTCYKLWQGILECWSQGKTS
jgi:hypothetical protein